MRDQGTDSHPLVTFDRDRQDRIGLPEAVLAEPKTIDQLAAIIGDAMAEGRRLLLTRLTPDQHAALGADARAALDYCATSRTAILGGCPEPDTRLRIALVSAGTSDAGPLIEAQRVLAHAGQGAHVFADCGVAALWRLTRHQETLRGMDVVIVFAGMDAALPSVVGGMVPGLVIAVPTSVGYGVATGGRVALDSALASCASGVLVTNIDNGYGAACAALRMANVTARGARP